MSAAYLVTAPAMGRAVLVDQARAVDYAAKRGGTVEPLVLKSDLDKMIAAVKEVHDTELGEIGCTGSMAPCEHALGVLFDLAGLAPRG